MKKMEVQFLSDNAIMPSRATPGAAGLDLYSTEKTKVYQNHITVVSTGISIKLPIDTVGLVWPRSGLAVKNGIHVMAGVIDSDFRGEVKVVLTKLNKGIFEIEEGDRIAQIVVQPVEFLSTKIVDSIGTSHRGNKGFGSTG